jgi:hypothetical protein
VRISTLRIFLNDARVDGRFARTIGNTFDRFSEAITVIVYDLDYDGYRHLLTFGPVIFNPQEHEPTVQWTVEPTGVLERFVTFAVDGTLRLENAAIRPQLGAY